MCGICGIVSMDPGRGVDAGQLEAMTGALAHRGPDASGFFRDGRAGLGHRRLSIIDLAGGSQPIYNEDGSVVIVFNGEIYNFAELKRLLESKGHVFRTRSDTEAIVHAYEEYGDDCVEKLRGMFAFALWDSRAGRLLLARDRLGKKPLYFHAGKGFFAFASEVKALLELDSTPRQVDETALDLFLSLRYVPGPRTLFRDIFKLQPGHILTLDATGARTRKYWDLEFQPDPGRRETDYLEEFRALLDESVSLRLISDVPLGVLLSGGLDSTAILATMSRLTPTRPIQAFSIGYRGTGPELQSDELSYARSAARAFRADHHFLRLGPEEFSAALPKLIWHMDEPLADASTIPLYFVSRLARERVTVVLSGEGADEVLAGYGIYGRMLQLERACGLLGAPARWLGPRLARFAPQGRAGKYLRMAGLPLEARYRGVSLGVSAPLKERLLGRSGTAVDELFGSYYRSVAHAGPLDRMLYLDTKVWLPDDLLLKADKMTMAVGLELRVPFLDHKLVEFAARLPAHLKLRNGRGKYLLREAMRGIVPETILRRPKKGFPVPTHSWLTRALRDFTRAALLDRSSACRRFFSSAALERAVAENETRRDTGESELWTLLVFELWHRIFIDREPTQVGRAASGTPGNSGPRRWVA